ncbi:MAG: lactate utilization protein [Actinomycetota bacterium]|nr:lactate utilization protein [Actinomycetota bacterium]
MDRDAFLDRVRSSIGEATLPDGPAIDPGPLVPDLPDVDLLQRFTEAVEAVSGTVHTGGVAAALDEIVASHGPGRLITWSESQLPADGAIHRLVDAGCETVSGIVPADASGRRNHQADYVDVRYGLTGAEAAFAESGSIVVRSGPGKPRMASLVPLIHIALLPVDRIFRSQMHWLTQPESDLAGAANVVYITGPSRTADIEQQINLGVHGPRELHIILIPA